MNEYETRALERARTNAELRRREENRIAEALDDRMVEYLEEYFLCDKPCFHGKRGEYDPLDAALHDGMRRVVLQLKLWRKRVRKEI